MKTLCRTLLFLGCAVCAVLLTGCASPRTGPFDVPVAVAPTGKAAESASGLEAAAAHIGASKIYFAFDRADLTPASRQTLDGVASLLARHPSLRVAVQGHCDERGTSEYNYKLGERRACAAYAYLVSVGANPAQLELVTYGEERPAVYGKTESAWAQNRRGEFVVLTTRY